MAITARYRINGGEVDKISLQGQLFTESNPTYYGVLTDPICPDGQTVRNMSTDPMGPLRVLGFAKIAIPGSNTCRNATAGEIATFATAQTVDEGAMDATAAASWIDTLPRHRKVFKAFLKRIIAENNLQAAQWNAFRVQVAAATNLANLQSRVATNTTDMPIRTLAQAVTALQGDISPND